MEEKGEKRGLKQKLFCLFYKLDSSITLRGGGAHLFHLPYELQASI